MISPGIFLVFKILIFWLVRGLKTARNSGKMAFSRHLVKSVGRPTHMPQGASNTAGGLGVL